MVKKLVPKERLLYLPLENGLSWDKICRFLDQPVPKEEFPRINDADGFHSMMAGILNPLLLDAMLKLGAVVVGVVGATGWAFWKYYMAQH